MCSCRLAILALVLSSVITFAVEALGQPTKLTVSYSADTPGQLSAWIAKDTGIYSKNGLDVQLIRATGNVAMMALLSGDISIGVTGGTGVIASNLSGSDAVMFAAGQVITDYVLVAQPKIKTAAQLKGGILGVSSLSGSSIFSTRFALRKLGLTDRDVSIIVVGGTPDRWAALQTGRIQATLLSPPTSIMAERDGFNILIDAGGLPFPYNTIATTRRFIRENQDTVRKYAKSHIEAVYRLKTNRETGIKVLAKYLRNVGDRYLLEKSYDLSVAEHILPSNQYPALAGIKTVLDMLAETNPKARTANPEDFVDARFIKELNESGFIDNLYQEKGVKVFDK
jgi:ABC-type nitrate/sulfonate/bicarbonate transport system substrate-binding protein